MRKINVLPDDVANKIAAGEVVERPFNVVKELVENSLDAGATKIEIELIDGGLSLIKVVDNGFGIDEEDLPLTVQRFATSKITKYEDIFSINSFGFRGEALSAISSVSDFSIKSKGNELRVSFGNIIGISPAAYTNGTIVTVKNLFEKVPARHKFLKSPTSENKEILKYVKHIALLNYNVSFKVINNGKVALELINNNNLLDRVKKIIGEDYSFIELNYENKVKISGVVTTPDVQKFRKDSIFIGVNRRAVKDNLIQQAILQAYHRKLPENRYPIAVLNIEISPDQIDVNVHPAKLFIRFYNSNLLFKEIYKAVESCLRNYDLKNNSKGTSDIPLEELNFAGVKEDEIKYTVDLSNIVDVVEISEEKNTKNNNFNLSYRRTLNKEFKIIGQLFDTVILVEYNDELWLIDQHIAHERVLYEKFINNADFVFSVYLTEPLLISIDEELVEFCIKNQAKLAKCGIDLEQFGKNVIKVNSVPSQFLNKDIEKEIKEFIKNSMESILDTDLSEPIYLNMSCKLAIKAGDKLLEEEMNDIVSNLLKCENPFTCPHGRPIVYKIKKEEIFKKFNRQ